MVHQSLSSNLKSKSDRCFLLLSLHSSHSPASLDKLPSIYSKSVIPFPLPHCYHNPNTIVSHLENNSLCLRLLAFLHLLHSQVIFFLSKSYYIILLLKMLHGPPSYLKLTFYSGLQSHTRSDFFPSLWLCLLTPSP